MQKPKKSKVKGLPPKKPVNYVPEKQLEKMISKIKNRCIHQIAILYDLKVNYIKNEKENENLHKNENLNENLHENTNKDENVNLHHDNLIENSHENQKNEIIGLRKDTPHKNHHHLSEAEIKEIKQNLKETLNYAQSTLDCKKYKFYLIFSEIFIRCII